MSVLTREQTTPGFVVIRAEVPNHLAARVEGLISEAMQEDEDDRKTVPADEVLGPHDPARCLRGARYRDGLTQKALADLIGVKPQHISEMERAKRPIGKDMAKRFARVFKTSYRVFL